MKVRGFPGPDNKTPDHRESQQKKPAPNAAGASGVGTNIKPADYSGASVSGSGTVMVMVLDLTVTLLSG
jgi:hypothetical protein